MIFKNRENEQKFDLNIETILENWESFHAVREIIANAIDEQLLSNSKDSEIYKDSEDRWHIRDYGRGLNFNHFTQNENEEKLNHQGIIGKFGIGLKDALATFDRNGIDVHIKSKYGSFTTGKSSKHGFKDVKTLHMYYENTKDNGFIGTDFILTGLSDDSMNKAKQCFLKISNTRVIEENSYGMVLENNGKNNIYINGVNVSSEENFLFGYNITNINSSIRKSINRERTNIGRNAYSSTIKSILLKCQSKEFATKLIEDFKDYSTGMMHDELQWIDIQEHAVKVINNSDKVVFVTNHEIEDSPELVEEIKSGGYSIINIPSALKDRIKDNTDNSGNIIRDFNQFRTEFNDSFEFDFVNRNELNILEKKNYDLIEKILSSIGFDRDKAPEIKISNKMQKDEYTFLEAEGIYHNRTIILKRSILLNKKKLFSTLVHEIAHYTSGASDVSRDFETELTRFIGILGGKLLKSTSNEEKMKNNIIAERMDKFSSVKEGIIKNFKK